MRAYVPLGLSSAGGQCYFATIINAQTFINTLTSLEIRLSYLA